MKQKLLIDIGGTLELKYYSNSLQAVPTSGTITIYDNAGAEKVLAGALVIDANGTMSYVVLAAVADDVYTNWKAVWTFIVDGVTLYRSTLLDVVRQVLNNPVVDKDITDAAPFLKDKNYSKIFTADSGSKTTIVSVELADQDDDYWNGGSVEVISGTNVGQVRKVTDFVKSTNTLTVDTFTAVIDATSKILLIRTFKTEIDRAFKRFKIDLKNRGIEMDSIIDNSQITEYLVILTLHYICDNFSTDIADSWGAKAAAYMEDYKKLVNVAVFEYDDDNDGNIGDDEGNGNIFQIEAER